MGPESQFIKSVHRYIPAGVYWMKNHNQYNGGIPDVWYSGNRADLWVEYKFIEVPKRGETIIDLSGLLSALQQDWLAARHAEGRNVVVIVGSADGGVWYDNLSWQIPIATKAFLSRLADRKTLAANIHGTTSSLHNVTSRDRGLSNRLNVHPAVLLGGSTARRKKAAAAET
jgi:hypothetical protein